MAEEKGLGAQSTNIWDKKLLFPIGLLSLFLWYIVYLNLKPLSDYLTFDAFGLSAGTHMGEAVNFFLYDTPKILMLLILIVFFIGIIRTFITPEKTKRVIAGKNEYAGNSLAAGLGIFTPFCSCSAVPLFVGFVSAGIPLGVTFSFLIAAPMVNEIALVLLYGLFGWKIAAIYLAAGILLAILAGIIIGKLKMEKHLQDWVQQVRVDEVQSDDEKKTFSDRIKFGFESVKEIVGKIWLYVIIGIAIGGIIHGYVPEGFLSRIMGESAWWAVPFSVIVGIPMYTNSAGIIPIVSALIEKGAALGTVLAFMMSVIALSLPEMLILRQVLKIRLIMVFIGTVGVGILGIGYLFNIIM